MSKKIFVIVLLFICSQFSRAEKLKGFVRQENNLWFIKQGNNSKYDIHHSYLIKKIDAPSMKLKDIFVEADVSIQKCSEKLCIEIKSIRPTVFDPIGNLYK